MTDTTNQNGKASNNGSFTNPAPQLSNRILAQYVRNLSFENQFAENDFESDSVPEISIKISLDSRKRNPANQYEVTTKLVASSKSKGEGKPLFHLSLEYAAVFEVKNVPEGQLSPFLYIECPRITYPFVRRIAMEITQDGGFPPLNLDNIDFYEMYKSEMQRKSGTD
jgi:preprotein translocase subunit SecB